MVRAATSFSKNRILAALPAEEYERIAMHSEIVSLSAGEILFWPDEEADRAYFPTTAVISLLTDLSDGTGIEVGPVGYEGMVGVSVVLGGAEMKVVMVQHPGNAVRIRSDIIREEFARGQTLQRELLRYMNALMAQISQSVVCNVRHKVEGRVARWLLMFRDRVASDEFKLTQELMANMLGVRRAGVSEIAANLQRMNFISYQRGNFRILDRAGLESFACECYGVVKERFDNVSL
jgi:CRP-like cAMP-binding protein